jgi:arabinose-5-phosphate isomerase
MQSEEIIEDIKSVLIQEANCIIDLVKHINQDLVRVIYEIQNCKGKIIFSGMGKAGHIGKKLAATFSSLGIPSFFVHPAEALHGDSGMVSKKDIIIFISNSGETIEVLNFLEIVKKIGSIIISMTGNLKSTLSKCSDIGIYCGVDKEADVLNLAPTSSTAAALALGDAIAITISKLNKFSAEDFKMYHPGGSLGRKLEGKIR